MLLDMSRHDKAPITRALLKSVTAARANLLGEAHYVGIARDKDNNMHRGTGIPCVLSKTHDMPGQKNQSTPARLAMCQPQQHMCLSSAHTHKVARVTPLPRTLTVQPQHWRARLRLLRKAAEASFFATRQHTQKEHARLLRGLMTDQSAVSSNQDTDQSEHAACRHSTHTPGAQLLPPR